MQLRCNRCQRPFAISRAAIYTAIQEVMANDLNHYNASCPHCRRVNRISRQELLRAAPDWEKQIAEQESEEGEEGPPDE
jgi:phage FluMu protein Com